MSLPRSRLWRMQRTPNKSYLSKPTGRLRRRRQARPRSQSLQVLQQVAELFLSELSAAGDGFRRVRTSEDIAERIGAAIVQQLDPLIDAAQARRVEPLVAIAG